MFDQDLDNIDRSRRSVSGETHLEGEAVSLLIQVNPDGDGDDGGGMGRRQCGLRF